jgi:hypothetical protein
MVSAMAAGPIGDGQEHPGDVEPETGTKRVRGYQGLHLPGWVRPGSMSRGERDMSDTEIWGACGHDWLDIACYAVGAVDDENEARAVDVQAVACAACSDELGDDLEIAGLIYEAVGVATVSARQPGCSDAGHRRFDAEDLGLARRAAKRTVSGWFQRR